MLHIDALRPDTAGLFSLLSNDPDIGQFTLIGGTALALHFAHRESEDLDFVWTPRRADSSVTDLDRRVTGAILDRLRLAGHAVESAFDQAAFDEAENAGVYLFDSQQNWLIDNVKLTFFAAETPAEAERFRTYGSTSKDNIRLLTAQALFETKSRLLTRRATSRDLFDLWYFLTQAGRTLEEVFAFALDQSPIYNDELTKKRLLPLRQHPLDPGYETLLDHGPKDFEDLIAEMKSLVAEYEAREVERLISAENWTPPRLD